MNEKTVDQLIENLTQDHKTVRPLARPVLRMLPWVGLTFAYLFFAGLIHGYRSDIPLKLQEFTFVFELCTALFIALSSALASAWLCLPDAGGKRAVFTLPVAGFIVFCLWTLYRLITEPFDSASLTFWHCLESGVLMGLIPGAVLWFMIKKGATTRPYAMSFMNILSVGFAGYIGLRLTCPFDSVMDSTIQHLIPFVAGGLIIGSFARKIYRW